ncbi:MAG: WD40/YVTN/BNR-like repeat-containing protein, partial [Gemmatimonadaceae bacterium]
MSRLTLRGAAGAALLLLALPLAAGAQQTTFDSTLWSGMHYRSIGPFRGGRVTAVTGVASQPRTFYFGSTGGGVWKTTDAGATWNNVSDGFFAVASMGALDVANSDPNVVYAGTGSSKIRSNVSIGRGIYKSTDAGRTWRFIGLENVGQISTVRVDPTNPDIVFVAALGNPFVNNVDRGVFKTTDGGTSWKKVLYLGDSLGAADLELQPGNPNVVFATMWRGQRKPWTIISGSMAGGIYKSVDGGATWNKLGGGLPTGLFGRANVAISNAAPNRIYANIEAKAGGGIYRSDDAGATW